MHSIGAVAGFVGVRLGSPWAITDSRVLHRRREGLQPLPHCSPSGTLSKDALLPALICLKVVSRSYSAHRVQINLCTEQIHS